MNGTRAESLEGAAAFFSGAFAMLQRDVRTFVSYRIRFVTLLLGQVFSLTLFYYLSRLVNFRGFDSPDEYYAYAVVGLVILQVLNSTLGTPPSQIRGELVAGTFERLFLSPLGPLVGCVTALLFPFVFALVMALMMLAFAALAFGLDIQWSTLPLAVPIGVLGSLAFMPFGIALLAVTIVVKQAASGTTWIIAGISLVSGLYFPTTLLPASIEWMAAVQPFTAAVELMRDVIVGYPMRDPAWLGLAKLVGFTTILLPPALLLLRFSIGRARASGTIIEY